MNWKGERIDILGVAVSAINMSNAIAVIEQWIAGTKKRAPARMQQHGLEWLFRLGSEPRRLWRRCAYIVSAFLILSIGELLRHAFRVSEVGPSGSGYRTWVG